MALRGPSSDTTQRDLMRGKKSLSVPLRSVSKGVYGVDSLDVGIVMLYEHLGSVVTAQATHNIEIRARAAAAQ